MKLLILTEVVKVGARERERERKRARTRERKRMIFPPRSIR